MGKVLIVDDSEIVRNVVKEKVEKAGHIPLEANDGNEGLMLAESNPDLRLIFCDVSMLVMDGLTMVKRIRENKALKEVPIVMLTTETSEKMQEQAKKLGVRAWMFKPFTPEKIEVVLKTLLK